MLDQTKLFRLRIGHATLSIVPSFNGNLKFKKIDIFYGKIFEPGVCVSYHKKIGPIGLAVLVKHEVEVHLIDFLNLIFP